MYPSRFGYESPRTVEEATALLHAGQGDAKVVAGGQSLVPMLKLRFANPETLVDINNLPDLDHLRVDADGSLHIGALTRHATLERSSLLPESFPTMAAAAPLIADPLVRNRGTLVGSLCHADPQGDWAAVVTAMRGSVVAAGPNGRRTIPMSGFVNGPFQNALAFDEVAVEAVIPPARGTRAGGYLKLERRVGDFATAGAAVSLELAADQTVAAAGIALTGVGGATIDAADAAAALVGAQLTAHSIEMAADLAAQAAQPRADHRGSVDYKRHVIATFVSRILTTISSTDSTDSTGRAAA